MKNKFGAILVLAALCVGALAVPATADPITGFGVFQGTADVGKQPGACEKGAIFTDPTGKGIGVPLDLLGTPKGANVDAFWRFEAPIILGAGLDNTTPILPPLFLDACGKLTSVAGIGAACGMSKGYDGIGRITREREVPSTTVAQFRELGWKISLGGTLPVIGIVEDADGKSKNGTVVALTQAQGAAACLDPDKARTFTVVGVAVFAGGPGDADKVTWNDITDPVDEKDGKDCNPLTHPCAGDELYNIWGTKGRPPHGN